MSAQRTFVVTGAKGGVGATTIAFELAERIRTGGPRALVDGDLAGRRSHAVTFDVAAALDRHRGLGAPASATARGKTLIELARTYEDGLLVSAAAVDEERALLPSDATIVVDAPQPFAEALRPFAARAACFVVVSEPTLLGAAAARGTLLALRRFGIPDQRVIVVMNEAHGVRELRAREIEEALSHPVAAELPQRRDRGWARGLDQIARELAAMDGGPLLTLLTAPAAPGPELRDAAPRAAGPALLSVAPPAPVLEVSAERERIKAELHEQIMERIDFQVAARAHTDAQKSAELRAQVDGIVAALLQERRDVSGPDEAAAIRREIVEEAVGLGPIERLLHDPDITEIMVNGFRNVYIERRGRLERMPMRFADDRQVRLVIERIITPLGRRIDEASPMVDARLPDGSRVNAIVEPLALEGPTLTIRRFGTRRLGMDDLIALDSLTPAYGEFLRACVESRLNIVVSGGTGSGKTTLLNAVSAYIPPGERILTVEDAAELLLAQPHVVRLESRPPNIEGTGAVPIRELVRNALRMRPDRIIVGECRAGEALDMLQAMNTGHDGSLTTVHANSPRDALARIETMVLMAGFDLPIRAIREQVSSAIDIVVQLARLRDGSRRLVSLSEVIGMEGDIITMQEIGRFHQRGVDTKGVVVGTFETTGVQPHCLTRFDEMGIEFDISSLGQRETEAVWALR